MLKKIKNISLTIASMFALGAPVMVPAMAHGQGNSVKDNLCLGVNQATGATETACVDKDLDASATPTIQKVINLISLLVGAISVLMIIFGGFRYITSGGDSTKVGNAKSTILYAIIGIVIVALAQIIIRFVITESAEVIK